MYGQPGGFVIGIKGAVTVSETGAAESSRGIGNQLPRRVLLRREGKSARHLKYQ
jgi:hypothetical protein